MNKTKIEWTDWTWNPISGCTNNCGFDCYARKMSKRLKGRFGYNKHRPFTPTFHENKLNEPFEKKNPLKIFTVSMGDFFDSKMLSEWQDKVMSVIWNNPQHTFQILTKQPWNIEYTNIPPNLWLGVSVTKPHDIEKMSTLYYRLRKHCSVLFVSIEPYLENLHDYKHFYERLMGFDWVIVGGLTGRKPFTPPKEWVGNIIEWCAWNSKPVFIKNNLPYFQESIYKRFPTQQKQLFETMEDEG